MEVLAREGARSLPIQYPVAAHQLVHFCMRRRAFHELARAGCLDLGKLTQESQRRPHRTRAQADSFHSQLDQLRNTRRTGHSEYVHRTLQIGNEASDRLRIANSRSENAIRACIPKCAKTPHRLVIPPTRVANL